MADAVFQFAPESSGGGRLGVSGAAPNLGVSGGRSVNNGAVRFADTTDLGAGSRLPEFLQSMVQPKIDALIQQRQWEGAVQASLGRTQAEISEDIPWYAKVFGPTPYETGAAVFTADKAVADLDTFVMDNMSRFRTMDSMEMAKEVQAKANEFVGDDPTSAMVVTQSLMKRMGPMLDVHAKQRYAWQQDELKRGAVSSFVAAARSHDATRKQLDMLGQSSPNDPTIGHQRADLTRNLLQSWQLPENMDDATRIAIYRESIVGMAQEGLFGPIAQFKESGIDQYLDPTQLGALESEVNTYWNKFTADQLSNNPEMQREIFNINMAVRQGIGGANTAEQMKDFDRRFQTLYGYKPYFDGQDYVNATTQSGAAHLANLEQEENERQRIAEARSKDDSAALLAAETTTQYAKNFREGRAAFAQSLPEYKKEDFENVAVQQFDQLVADGKGTFASQLLVDHQANLGEPITPLVRRFKAEVANATTGAYSDSYLAVQAKYDAVRQGVGSKYDPVTKQFVSKDTGAGLATAHVMFGEDAARRMELFATHRKNGSSNVDAYMKAWGDSPENRPTVIARSADDNKRARKAFKEVVSDLPPVKYGTTFGGTSARLNSYSQDALSYAIAPYYDQLADIGDVEDRAQQTISLARAAGVEIHGSFFWKNPSGPDQPRIASYFTNQNDSSISVLVDHAIKQKMKTEAFMEYGKDTRVNVSRVFDSVRVINGVRKTVPQLWVTAEDDEGVKSFMVDYDDIEAVRQKPPTRTVGDELPDMVWTRGR